MQRKLKIGIVGNRENMILVKVLEQTHTATDFAPSYGEDGSIFTANNDIRILSGKVAMPKFSDNSLTVNNTGRCGSSIEIEIPIDKIEKVFAAVDEYNKVFSKIFPIYFIGNSDAWDNTAYVVFNGPNNGIQVTLDGKEHLLVENLSWYEKNGSVVGRETAMSRLVLPNRVFSMGDKFTRTDKIDNVYILAQVGCGKFCLISTLDGNRFTDPLDAPSQIPESVVKALCGSRVGHFKVITGKNTGSLV